MLNDFPWPVSVIVRALSNMPYPNTGYTRAEEGIGENVMPLDRFIVVMGPLKPSVHRAWMTYDVELGKLISYERSWVQIAAGFLPDLA